MASKLFMALALVALVAAPGELGFRPFGGRLLRWKLARSRGLACCPRLASYLNNMYI